MLCIQIFNLQNKLILNCIDVINNLKLYMIKRHKKLLLKTSKIYKRVWFNCYL